VRQARDIAEGYTYIEDASSKMPKQDKMLFKLLAKIFHFPWWNAINPWSLVETPVPVSVSVHCGGPKTEPEAQAQAQAEAEAEAQSINSNSNNEHNTTSITSPKSTRTSCRTSLLFI
jgi:hypothetical protein